MIAAAVSLAISALTSLKSAPSEQDTSQGLDKTVHNRHKNHGPDLASQQALAAKSSSTPSTATSAGSINTIA